MRRLGVGATYCPKMALNKPKTASGRKGGREGETKGEGKKGRRERQRGEGEGRREGEVEGGKEGGREGGKLSTKNAEVGKAEADNQWRQCTGPEAQEELEAGLLVCSGAQKR